MSRRPTGVSLAFLAAPPLHPQVRSRRPRVAIALAMLSAVLVILLVGGVR